MSKLVVLNIDEGSFEQGFPVRLEIGEDGRIYHRIRGEIPPAPELPQLYEALTERYYELGGMSQINIPAQTTHYSLLEDCHEAARRLKNYLREWFNQLPWRELRVRIEERVRYDESVQVIFHTQNIYLKKLPWQLWDLFETREYAQFALSAEYAGSSAPLKHPVRILAIFGGSQGLNLQPIRRSLQELRRQGAIVQLLENPRREQLSNGLWEQHWDILFFAGHSRSLLEGHSGEIQINDTETLSLDRLRSALRTAVRNGLKLAIFNSCDGLGLAAQSTRVGVPQVIVMREPVPDEVAQRFLQYFLSSFSSGKSFYLAVREARERLEVMEDDNPCASWLPIICQNPAAKPLLWPKKLSRFAKRAVVAVVAIALTFFIYTKTSHYSKPTVQVQMSQGEQFLIASNFDDDKKAGAAAFARKDFSIAIEHFRKSLQQRFKDPETVIYLNNAVSHEPAKIKELLVPKSVSSKTCFVSQNTQKPLNIAVSVPIGLDSHLAQEILRGVAQAQNEINCTGGINGNLLQVTILDDKDDSALAEQVAEQLLKNPDILGVIGHYSSSATLKAGKIYDKQLVAISPTSNAIRRSTNNPNGLDFSEYVFRTAVIGANELVEYMVDGLRNRKAAIAFDPHRDYSKSFHDEFQRYLTLRGGQVVDVSECHLDANFRADECVKKAIDKQAEVVLIVPEINNTYDKALQLLDANYNSSKKLPLLGASSMYSDKTLAKRRYAEHLVIAVPWHRNQSNPSEFELDAKSLWNTSAVNWHTETAYDATVAIAEGLKSMGDNPTRQGLKKVLSARGFLAKGTAGTVEFDETGDRKVNAKTDTRIGVLVEVQPARQSQYGYDFVLLQH